MRLTLTISLVKLMQQGKRPYGIGTWFSLGYSTIFIVASAVIAATATAFSQQMDWFHTYRGIKGTAISATFLLILAFINLVILCRTGHYFQTLKQGKTFNERLATDDGMME